MGNARSKLPGVELHTLGVSSFGTRVLALPVTYKALQCMDHVRTVSPALRRLLDQHAICSPLA
eukprot:6857328-Lingulodinium_polyedra.AAC.1